MLSFAISCSTTHPHLQLLFHFPAQSGCCCLFSAILDFFRRGSLSLFDEGAMVASSLGRPGGPEGRKNQGFQTRLAGGKVGSLGSSAATSVHW